MTEGWGSPRQALAWNCRYCDGAATLEIVERWWNSPEGDQDFDPFENVLARCTSCKMPYVLGRDAAQTFDGWEEAPLQQIYPEDRPPLPGYVPASIRDSHDEAVRCVRVRAYTAASLMARRGVEAICAEHGETKGNLDAKLKNLQSSSVIDGRLYEWSSVVRNLGNAGAHDVDATLSREDADDSIAFFEALVNYLYTFKQRYELHLRRKTVEKDLKDLL